MTTTPTLLTRQTINGQIFTSHRALYKTPSYSCGVRITYRIDGKTIPRTAWEHRRTEGLMEEMLSPVGEG